MYIAGRLRTASRPSRTAIDDESYMSFLFFNFDVGVANFFDTFEYVSSFLNQIPGLHHCREQRFLGRFSVSHLIEIRSLIEPLKVASL